MDALLSLSNIRDKYGCSGKNSNWKEWVFPRMGSKGVPEFGKAFFDLAKAKGVTGPPDPHSGLYYRRDLEEPIQSGDQAEARFFSTFSFLSDFFAHPTNAARLGMLLRQFMSKYCGNDILRGFPKEVTKGLERAEESLINTCGGSHAFATDTLRLLYNSAMVKLVGTGAGHEIGAIYLGESGGKLTPIGTPPALTARIEHDEREFRGKVFCIDQRTGRCYDRGGWTEGEWSEAMARVEAESGGSLESKRARARALDSHYFPERLSSSIGLRYNILSELCDEAIVHCQQGSVFQISRLSTKLSDGKRVPESRGRDDSSYFEIVDEGASDSIRFLPAPGETDEMVPDDTGLEGIETAEARGVAKKIGFGAEPAKTRGGINDNADFSKAAKRFFKSKGIEGNEVTQSQLENILKTGGFSVADYSDEHSVFSKGIPGDPSLSGGIEEWRKTAGAVSSPNEAVHLWKGYCRRGGRGGISLKADGGVYFVGKKSGKVEVSFAKDSEFDSGAELKKGKIYYAGRAYTAISAVDRTPFGDGSVRKGGGLKKGGSGTIGIFGALRKVFRGGI